MLSKSKSKEDAVEIPTDEQKLEGLKQQFEDAKANLYRIEGAMLYAEQQIKEKN